MEKPTEEQVTKRAYQLWEQAGMPEGRDQEFYYMAEQEMSGPEATKENPEDTTRLE